ncbi:MAG: hypothetical protein ACOH2K_06470, partial [Burkholderiaceae bacterium]
VVYRTAVGGGAKIVDKFGDALETSTPVPHRSTEDNISSTKELGQRHAAGVRAGHYLKLGKYLSGQWGPL